MPPTTTEVAKGIAAAGDVPLGHTEIVAGDILPMQSQNSGHSWIAFVWDYILFSATNY